jgi:prophage regulatory protein
MIDERLSQTVSTGGTVKPKSIDTSRIQARHDAQAHHANEPVTAQESNQASATTRPAAPPLRLIRFPSVRERTGLSRSTVWRLERKGAFPKHRRISPNAVGWLEHEIEEWIQTRMRAA